MIKLYLIIMNGIIYKITVICLALIVFSCKKESVNKQPKNDLLRITDIGLIEPQDTLRLDFNGDDLGDGIDGNNDFQYKSLLFNKIVLDSGAVAKLKKLGYIDKKEFGWIRIKNRIKLRSNFNTVIISNLESAYILLNYNSKDELIDFLDLSKYNQQICQCTSSVYINKDGIIHCQIESGRPFYPYLDYKVNDKGKFEIVDQFIPPNEELMSPTERLDYTIKKTAQISGNVNLKSYLESDEFTPSNTTFFDVKEIKNILFSKSHSEEVYNFFNESVDHYIKEGKGFNVLGKVSNKDKLLLLCLSETEQFAVIFIMNKNNEIIDSKFIIVGDPAINESIFDFVED